MESAKRIIIITVFFFGFICGIQAQRRPIIGISDFYKNDNNAAVARSYVDAVLVSGGVPVVIPLIHEEEKLIELLNSLDGVVFTGGEDFDPAYYNERPIPQMGKVNAPRDVFDIKLLKLTAERGIPVLGICRGLQLINITFGGTLYQDLRAQYNDNSIQHRQAQAKDDVSHSVLVEENTVFANIVKERMLMVNSSHHQAIKDLAPGFRIAGRSPDRVVEVIEKIDNEHWILGVQFHPEVRVLRDNAMRRIFQHFIEEAGAHENPNRTVKIASQPTPKLLSESSQRSSRDLALARGQARFSQSSLGEPPLAARASNSEFESDANSNSISNINTETVRPIIYTSVIDTQIIYKFITDTVYLSTQTLSVPADTVYVEVRDTQYVTVPQTQYVYVSDTVYLSTPDMASLPSDTLIFTPGVPVLASNASVKESAKAKKKAEKAKAKAEKDAQALQIAQQKQILKEYNEKEALKKKAAAEQAKLAEKEVKEQVVQLQEQTTLSGKQAKKQAKQAKKEAEAQASQYREEQMEQAKRRKQEIAEKSKMEKEAKKQQAAAEKKAHKERTEKEKAAQKEAAQKEKQFQKEQKEHAKTDKKELKEKKKKGQEEREEGAVSVVNEEKTE